MGGKFFDATWLQIISFLTIEVQIEPMSELNLEEDADQILALLFRDVYYEATVKDEKKTNAVVK